jgi:hypothetical protein
MPQHKKNQDQRLKVKLKQTIKNTHISIKHLLMTFIQISQTLKYMNQWRVL